MEVVANEALGYDMKGVCEGIFFSWNVPEEKTGIGGSKPVVSVTEQL